LAVVIAAFLTDVNRATNDFYKHENHALNTIRLETSDGGKYNWEWTNILDPKGYEHARELAVSHAKKQGA